MVVVLRSPTDVAQMVGDAAAAGAADLVYGGVVLVDELDWPEHRGVLCAVAGSPAG